MILSFPNISKYFAPRAECLENIPVYSRIWNWATKSKYLHFGRYFHLFWHKGTINYCWLQTMYCHSQTNAFLRPPFHLEENKANYFHPHCSVATILVNVFTCPHKCIFELMHTFDVLLPIIHAKMPENTIGSDCKWCLYFHLSHTRSSEVRKRLIFKHFLKVDICISVFRHFNVNKRWKMCIKNCKFTYKNAKAELKVNFSVHLQSFAGETFSTRKLVRSLANSFQMFGRHGWF